MIYTDQINDVETHIIHPLATQTTHKLLNTLDVSNLFDDNVYIKGKNIKGSKTSDTKNRPKLKNNFVECNMVVNYNPNATEWDVKKGALYSGKILNSYGMENEYPIFIDTLTNTTVFERAIPCNLQLEFKFNFKHEQDATRTLNKIYTLNLHDNMFNYTDLMYDYKLSDNIVYLLYMSYKQTGQEPSEFLKYLRIHSENKISMNINRNVDQNDKEVSIQNNIPQCLSMINISQEEVETESSGKSTDNYIINFSSLIQFMRPNHTCITFPVVIYNQLVPRYAIEVTKGPDRQHYVFDRNNMVFDKISKKFYLGTTNDPVRVPWYDEWIVKNHALPFNRKYNPFFYSIVILDGDTTAIDLTGDLGGVKFRKELIDILYKQGKDTLYTTKKINITIYSNDIQLEPRELTWMETMDGKILLILNKKDITKQYHMVVSEKTVPGHQMCWLWVIDADIVVHREKYFQPKRRFRQ